MAGSATWKSAPTTNAFDDGDNWDTGSVPTAIATFGASSTTTITVDAPTTIGELLFGLGAPAYTLNVSANLTLDGGGIVRNLSAVAPTINLIGSGGRLTVDTDGSSTVDASVTGIGGLIKQGSGTLTLTGNNTYFGGTTVSSGVLAGRAGRSIQGNILNNATVLFQDGTGTYAGVISGSGSVTFGSGATVTLTGNNTYSGGTTLANGGADLLPGFRTRV